MKTIENGFADIETSTSFSMSAQRFSQLSMLIYLRKERTLKTIENGFADIENSIPIFNVRAATFTAFNVD